MRVRVQIALFFFDFRLEREIMNVALPDQSEQMRVRVNFRSRSRFKLTEHAQYMKSSVV